MHTGGQGESNQPSMRAGAIQMAGVFDSSKREQQDEWDFSLSLREQVHPFSLTLEHQMSVWALDSGTHISIPHFCQVSSFIQLVSLSACAWMGAKSSYWIPCCPASRCPAVGLFSLCNDRSLFPEYSPSHLSTFLQALLEVSSWRTNTRVMLMPFVLELNF